MRTEPRVVSWRALCAPLAAIGVLSLLDWALTAWALSPARVRAGGTGWREGNPVTGWVLAHGGTWGFLGDKVLLFLAVLVLTVHLRRIPWRPARWIILAALGVATFIQALAVVGSAHAILTHGA